MKDIIYLTDNLYIDFKLKRMCARSGQFENLRPMDIKLLEYLSINGGIVISTDSIMDNVWGDKDTEKDQVRGAKARIVKAIRRLAPDAEPDAILETRRGSGLVLHVKKDTSVKTMSDTELQMLVDKAHLKKDYEEYGAARKLYEQAAEQGCAQAINGLGILYAKGQGVKKDEKKGFAYYEKAAEMGYHSAQLNAGDCYWDGRGVEQDKAKAVEYYLLAANNPDEPDGDAMYRLYECYRDGDGVEKNIAQAAMWRERAVEMEKNYRKDYYKDVK